MSRRFYSLPCWMIWVDGERFSVASNDMEGAKDCAVLAWRFKHGGNRVPSTVELRGLA